MDDIVDRIKQSILLEDIVAEYITLKKAGRNFRGLCPFHNEKTPSFFISPERQTFKCFGCGKGGDVFTFMQEIEGISFKEAIIKLAEKASISLPENFTVNRDKKAENQKSIYFQIMKDALVEFKKNLFVNPEARDYLNKRGVTEKQIEEFKIGFANCSWSDLLDKLQKKYSIQDLIESGLVVKSEKGKMFDKFRCRVMFPIANHKGDIVAFTGRILPSRQDETPAKYLNSPETKFFIKSRILFAYNIARVYIRKYNFAILTEGQMDTIALHSVGYKNTIASSGTSTTKDHISAIKRLTDNLIIVFDSDEAGFNASVKVAKLAIGAGMNVKVIDLPKNMDPADFVSKHGKEAFAALIKNAKSLYSFVIDKKANTKKDKISQIRQIKDLLFDAILLIKDPIEKKIAISEIAERLNVSFDTIQESIELYKQNLSKNDLSNYALTHKHVLDREPTFTNLPIEDKLAAIYNWKKINKIKEIFEDYLPKTKTNELLTKYEGNDAIIFALEKEYEDDEVLRKDLEVYIKIFKLEKLKQKLKYLSDNLRNTKTEKEEEDIMRQIQIVSKKISELSQ